MAESASAPAPAPATGRGRPASAAPGPIELADEKTVQTLATPDSFGAPLARLSPSPTGHGYGSTPPSASTARRGARNHAFFPPPTRAPRQPRRRRRRAAAAAAPSTGGREAAPPPSRYQPRPYHDLCPRKIQIGAPQTRSAQVYGTNNTDAPCAPFRRPLIPPYRLIIVHRSTGRVVGGVGWPV